MNEGIVEVIIDQAVFEFLYEIQNSVVEVLRWAWVVTEWFLGRYVAVQELLCEDVLLV